MSDLTYKVLNTDGTITVYDKAAEIDSQLTDMLNKSFTDFLDGTSNLPWAATAVASGTKTLDTGIAKHPGTMILLSSTNADSGHIFSISSGSLIFNGGEKTTIILKVPSSLVGTTIRWGFIDTATVADCTDGAYLEIAKVGETEGVTIGKTANNGTRSATETSYTLAVSTWYRFVITVAADKSSVLFEIYADDSTSLLWSATLAANIPPTSRTFGNGIIATNSGTSAKGLCVIDYMDVILNGARRVV